MPEKSKSFYEFSDFRFDSDKRMLWRDGNFIALTPKAGEVLSVLIENHGNLIEREEILQRVWPDTFVEEGSLNNTISALRKALGGNGIIQTVPRRGYRLTADVRAVSDTGESSLVLEKYTVSHTLVEFQEETREENPNRSLTVFGFSNRLNIRLALFFVLLLALSTLAMYFRQNSDQDFAGKTNGVRTLAILPLEPLNQHSDENAFGLGITESLISRLSSLENLTIRPTRSVQRLAQTEDDPLKIGRQLKTDVIMTGTFQRAGGRIRLTIRLLNVGDGSQIWTGSFDEEEADLFKLQDSFAGQIIQSLALNLTAQEKLVLNKRSTENGEAYKFYLQGREFWNKRGDLNVSKSIFYFERAIELDRNFAQAYAGLADAQIMLGQTELAEENIRRALNLDQTLAEAHASFGFIRLFHHFDWATAEKALKRAIELNPNYATAHHWLGFYYALHRRFDEALAEMVVAHNLDPSSPIILADIGQVHYFMRDYEKAIEFCTKAVALDPEARIAHEYLLYIYYKLGQEKEAFEENIKTERANTTNPNEYEKQTREGFGITGIRGIFEGRLKYGLEDLERPPEKRVGPYPVSEIFKNSALLGNNEEALKWIDRAYEERRIYHLIYLNVDPIYDDLRADPRFQAVLRKMNFR